MVEEEKSNYVVLLHSHVTTKTTKLCTLTLGYLPHMYYSFPILLFLSHTKNVRFIFTVLPEIVIFTIIMIFTEIYVHILFILRVNY